MFKIMVFEKKNFEILGQKKIFLKCAQNFPNARGDQKFFLGLLWGGFGPRYNLLPNSPWFGVSRAIFLRFLAPKYPNFAHRDLVNARTQALGAREFAKTFLLGYTI